jgi:hypothetical protein
MPCTHPGEPAKVIDRLGMMRERPDGSVNAPVTAWHYECPSCGATLSSHSAPDPEDSIEAVEHAIRKTAHAVAVTVRYLRGDR